MNNWTLDAGVKFCQLLDRKVRLYNAFVALTGSVLHHGKSDKDLDIMIIPLKNNLNKYCVERIKHVLGTMKLTYDRTVDTQKYGDDKYVEVWCTPTKQRVDIIWVKLDAF